MLATVRLLPLALVLVLASAAVGCGGGSGEKTFSQDGFGITFHYPGGFKTADSIHIASTAGSAATRRAGVGLDAHNLIIVSRFDLRRAITPANVSAVKGELDAVMSQVSGQQSHGKRVSFGGLPGYEYVFDITDPAVARSRVVALFDGRVEYTINCQATAAKRKAMAAGCERALATLQRKA